MSHSDGYAQFKQFAQSIGRGAEWVEWGEDESCPQRSVGTDTPEAPLHAPYCEYLERVAELASGGTNTNDGDDSMEPNDDASQANTVLLPVSIEAQLCADNEDWFEFYIDRYATIDVSFAHDLGDIDIELFDSQGNWIKTSQSETDNERLVMQGLEAGIYQLSIYHYENTGACQSYSLAVY
jgi:hypothetical protein